MKRLSWLDEKKEEIIKLYNEGKTQSEVANCFNTSTSSISTRLRKWGVSNPDGNRFKRVDIDKDTLYDMYWNKEMHPVQIGDQYGITKMAVIKKMQKYSIPMRTKSAARKGKLNPIYGVGHTEKARKKMSNSFSNGTRTSFGYSGNWGNVDLYDTPEQGMVLMRSSWETKTADYLTNKKVKWLYESKWLDLGDRKYLPDFFLPEFNIYIEVKGRNKPEDLLKAKKAKKLGYKVLLWDGEELLKRGIITNSGYTELNRKYTDKKPYVDNWDIYKSK